uniref:TSC-22/dip/bun family protein n=2 Tax=Wuchereria bancrofti TaxID=6293 RepID=A0A1I8EMP2_WUCBA
NFFAKSHRFLSRLIVGRVRRSSLRPDGNGYQTLNAETVPAGGTVVASSGTGANTPIIAIDGKIEQAMDLVKTHLMFAVHEEIDVLRTKIMELKATILQLEAENTILREHVPVEILNKLSVQTTPSNSITTAAAV